jgi:uncharacterized protein (UPF0332 family)
VTPESARFLDKAEKLLAEAEVMIGVGLNEAAGRSAYLAGFHAAQAYVFERRGRVLKTHNGLQSEFLRLTRSEDRIGPSVRSFLSRAYNLKAIADYETEPDSEITAERARNAIRGAQAFVSEVAAAVDVRSSGDV